MGRIKSITVAKINQWYNSEHLFNFLISIVTSRPFAFTWFLRVTSHDLIPSNFTNQQWFMISLVGFLITRYGMLGQWRIRCERYRVLSLNYGKFDCPLPGGWICSQKPQKPPKIIFFDHRREDLIGAGLGSLITELSHIHLAKWRETVEVIEPYEY